MVIFGSITLSAVKYALDRRFITMESMDVMSSKVTPTMLWESLTIIGNTVLMEQTWSFMYFWPSRTRNSITIKAEMDMVKMALKVKAMVRDHPVTIAIHIRLGMEVVQYTLMMGMAFTKGTHPVVELLQSSPFQTQHNPMEVGAPALPPQ
jgi:hypothetical protein